MIGPPEQVIGKPEKSDAAAFLQSVLEKRVKEISHVERCAAGGDVQIQGGRIARP
jgi:hypothetical protein